jgi:hypothetical protein
MTAAAEVLARKSGFCCLCKLRIRRGEDYISPVGKRWAHASCAAGYRRVFAENEEAAS